MSAIDSSQQGDWPETGEGEAMIQAFLDEDLDAEEFERLQRWLIEAFVLYNNETSE